MALISYLNQIAASNMEQMDIRVEYRLVCGGELYSTRIEERPWRRFDLARLIVERPFELWVVSRPFNQFPQELCLRFGLNYQMERQEGGGLVGGIPDDREIVEDICAILSLWTRRPVVPAYEVGKTIKNPGFSYRGDSFRREMLSPTVGQFNSSRLGSRIIREVNTEQGMDYVEHVPPGVGLDCEMLTHLFHSLKDYKLAEDIVLAARAYSSALSMVVTNSELAYQLLVSAAESFACKVVTEEPEESVIIDRYKTVVQKAMSFGLCSAEAEELALAAGREERWIAWKLKTFLSRARDADIWGEDEVFPVADGYVPNKENFEKVIGAIYSARSKNLHERKAMPFWIHPTNIALTPREMYQIPNDSKYIPPVMWFERLVGASLKSVLAEIRH